MTPQEARTKLAREVARSTRENDGWPGEADDAINEASREVVRAMHAEHGQAWLGHVNLYKEKPRAVMQKWSGDSCAIGNFSASFVAPRFDEELERLIIDRSNAGYTNAKDDYARIQEIHARLEAIGGVNLIWT